MVAEFSSRPFKKIKTFPPPPLGSLLECGCCQAIFLEGPQEHQAEDHGREMVKPHGLKHTFQL